MNKTLKRVLTETAFIAVITTCVGLGCFFVGRAYEANNNHYRLRALQLTVNDIPVEFIDYLPGMNGTKDKPELCGAYYDSVRQAVMLIEINK